MTVHLTCDTCLESSQVATQCSRCGDFWLLCCLVSGVCARCVVLAKRASA